MELETMILVIWGPAARTTMCPCHVWAGLARPYTTWLGGPGSGCQGRSRVCTRKALPGKARIQEVTPLGVWLPANVRGDPSAGPVTHWTRSTCRTCNLKGARCGSIDETARDWKVGSGPTRPMTPLTGPPGHGSDPQFSAPDDSQLDASSRTRWGHSRHFLAADSQVFVIL